MPALRIVIAVVITMIWAAVYTADVVSSTFAAPPEVSGPMLAVVTWLFGAEIRKQVKRNGNGGG